MDKTLTLKTGNDELDQVLVSHIRPGHVAVLVGRPNSGRTTTASYIAVGAVNAGHGVLLYGDVGRSLMEERLLGQGIPFSLTDEGNERILQMENKFMVVRGRKHDLFGRLQELIYRFEDKYQERPKLICITTDEPMYFPPELRARGVAELFQGLKDMAWSSETAFLVTVQVSRASGFEDYGSESEALKWLHINPFERIHVDLAVRPSKLPVLPADYEEPLLWVRRSAFVEQKTELPGMLQ